jgi:ABC-type Mn2+/Zn2+ transport system ATPase subunit
MKNRSTIIELKHVRIQRGSRPVLESFDFTVRSGERVIVAGQNGTGKTTLLKAILGLIPHQAGEIRVLGARVGSRGWSRKRQRLGYVHQEGIQADLPISAYEVSEIGACRHTRSAHKRRAVVEEAMSLTGCNHLRRRLYSQLSGGERQKVSLARCLSQHAQVLVLDEPTSSLDPSSRREFMELLERLNRERGITILMATHDSDVLKRDDWRIYRLEDGRFRPENEGILLTFPRPVVAS